MKGLESTTTSVATAPLIAKHPVMRHAAWLLLMLGILVVPPVQAEIDPTCLEIYIGTGAIPVGPNATFQALLNCELTARNFHSNLGNYYCKNHTDEYCGTACPANTTDLHLCFEENEEDEDEEKEQDDSCDGEGNPCNPASGNKHQEAVDYRSYDGRLILVRSYNSLSPADGPFGYGWSATGLTHLAIESADKLRIHQATGRSEPWQRVNGQWQGDPDSRLKLQADGDGYRLENPDLSIEHYDAQGRLTSRTKTGGLTSQYAYDAGGRLETMTGPFGRSLAFSYNASGHVQGITTPDGELSYAYDTQGNLIGVTYPDGQSKHYHYEDTAHPHHLTGITDERGERYATWSYQADGKVISSEHAGGVERVTFSYSADGSTTQVTGALGDSRTYSHKLMHGVRKITAISGDPCTTCGNGQLQSRSYDADGFLTGYHDWNGSETRLTRNARHLIESRTEAAGTPQERRVTTEWHPDFDRPVRIVEPARTTELSYDAERRLLSQTLIDNASGETRTTTYSYHPAGSPGAGLLATVDGPRTDLSDITTYDYDAQGNLVTVTNALGQTTHITAHDPSGRPLTLVDFNGLSTELAYDRRGRLTRQSVSDGTTTRVTAYSYDPSGNLTQVTSPDGSQLHLDYDAAQRLIGLEDGEGNRIDYTLDPMGHSLATRVSDPTGTLARQRRQVYNQLGRLTQSLDAQDQATAYAYDANGNLTQTTDARQHPTRQAYDALERLQQSSDPLDGTTQYTYDAQNNLTSVTDPNGLATRYEYDGLGNLITQTSPDTGTTIYTYDEAGNQLSKTDAKGQTSAYAYDALDRLIRIEHPDARQTHYNYDDCEQGIGHLCRLIDANATTEWRYNAYGEILGKSQTLDDLTLNTGYTHDEQGRLSQMIYPSGATLAYRYNPQGRLTAIDLDGDPLIVGIAYAPFGPVSGWAWSDGRIERRDYNLDGRLIEQTLGNDQRRLDYDPVGNIIALSDTKTELSLDYDALDRLIKASDNDYALSWSYDPNGNRLSQILDGVASDYTYVPQSNQLNQVDTKVYRHDENGNRIDDGKHVYRYDSDNRLIEVNEGATARYRHNALGQRIGKSTYQGGDGADYLALAEAAEVQAQDYGTAADALDQQAQVAEGEAAQLRSEADEAQRQSAQTTLEAEGLALAARKARQGADTLERTAEQLSQKAADYRAKIITDPRNLKERLQNATYKKLAEESEGLAAKAEKETQSLRAKGDDLAGQAETKQAEAEALIEQIASQRQAAASKEAEASQHKQEAQAQRQLAEQAQAQAAEYRRLAEEGSGTTTQTITLFVYDEQGRLIGEYDEAGNPRQETVYLGDLPIATFQGGAVYAIHSDHLGTPRVITDSSHTEVWRWDSEPFGNTPANEDPDQDGTPLSYNLRFPGQYFDLETGLHYNYFRDYDPSTGRYITSDPIGLWGGLNTYGYVGGNPVNWIDPMGLEITGTYNKDTGTLTITNSDNGQTHSAPAFSGTPGLYSSAPNGTYTVSDFNWGSAAQDNYFALLLNDGRLDDYADGYPSNYDPSQTMSNIRLHSGYASHACVTVPSDADSDPWLPIQNMIQVTSQGSPVIIGGQSFPNYGTIQVIGSGFGAVP